MDSLIYVVGVPDSATAPVKIGTATNVAARLIQIQRGESTPLKVTGMIGDPTRLDILLSFPGDEKLERILHSTFADRRVEGEWFYLGAAETAVQRVEEAMERLTPRPVRTRATVVTLPLVEPEPLTHLAQAAAQHHELFRAWLDAGFTEDQAIRLLAQALKAAGMMDGWHGAPASTA